LNNRWDCVIANRNGIDKRALGDRRDLNGKARRKNGSIISLIVGDKVNNDSIGPGEYHNSIICRRHTNPQIATENETQICENPDLDTSFFLRPVISNPNRTYPIPRRME